MSAADRPPIACRFGPLKSIDVDLLVLPWFEAEGAVDFEALDRATGNEISRALNTREFAGKPFEFFLTPIVDRTWKPRRIALVGAGREPAFEPGVARRLATAAGIAARSRRVATLGLVMRPGQAAPSGDVDVAGFVQAMAEGLTLSVGNSRTRGAPAR